VTQESTGVIENVVWASAAHSQSLPAFAVPFATTGPGPLPIETVSERRAQRRTEDHADFYVAGLDHNENMLAVYLPRRKLINADLWGRRSGAAPPANVSASAVVLYNTIKRLDWMLPCMCRSMAGRTECGFRANRWDR